MGTGSVADDEATRYVAAVDVATGKDSPPGDGADVADAAVYEFHANRAIIEQAKGMLMFVYGVDADAAFGVLREQSQRHNVKLRQIALQVSTDLVDLSRASSPLRRIEHDLLLRTAHQRIANAAVRHTDARSTTGT